MSGAIVMRTVKSRESVPPLISANFLLPPLNQRNEIQLPVNITGNLYFPPNNIPAQCQLLRSFSQGKKTDMEENLFFLWSKIFVASVVVVLKFNTENQPIATVNLCQSKKVPLVLSLWKLTSQKQNGILLTR